MCIEIQLHLFYQTSDLNFISAASLTLVNANEIHSYCITIAAATALFLVLRRENKKRDSIPIDEAERDKLAFMDLTDQENPYFRYVL